MKLNETDLPREDVLKNEKSHAVESEEWTHQQTSTTTVRQNPNQTCPKKIDQRQQTVKGDTPRLENHSRDRRREKRREI